MIRPKTEHAKPNPEQNVSQLSKKFMIRNPENMNRNVLMDACHRMKQDYYNAKVCLHFFSCLFRHVFSKFYGKIGVISWWHFRFIWKNYVLYWDFDLKSWIVDFLTHFTHEKTQQNNFSRIENNYFIQNKNLLIELLYSYVF